MEAKKAFTIGLTIFFGLTVVILLFLFAPIIAFGLLVFGAVIGFRRLDNKFG